MAIIKQFLAEAQRINRTGLATEHSYRSALEKLIGDFDNQVRALNEPKRVACGAPDFSAY